MRVARISWSPTGLSRDTLCKAKGITLIESTQVRRFSRWSGGGGWSLSSETKSLRIKPKDHQAGVHSDQIVLVIASRRLVRVSRNRTQGLHSLKLKPRRTSWLESDSDHMFLIVVRWEALPVASGQRHSKRAENDSRNPGDKTKNRQKQSLK